MGCMVDVAGFNRSDLRQALITRELQKGDSQLQSLSTRLCSDSWEKNATQAGSLRCTAYMQVVQFQRNASKVISTNGCGDGLLGCYGFHV